MRAGFAQVDITPPLGTQKVGWLKEQVPDRVLDPLYGRLAILESGEEQVAWIGVDVLSLRWSTVNDLRQRLRAQYGFPGERVMVAASHNHAGPATTGFATQPRDHAYVETMTQRLVAGFGEALGALQPAGVGLGSMRESRISFNRRVVLRDGTVRTHGLLAQEDALHIEGPIDPEVAVLAAWDAAGRLLGTVVNFACHPTHHGDGPVFSAGYPGCLAREMAARGCPVTVFLNGACGNLHFSDPAGRPAPSMEEMGRVLAEDVQGVLARMPQRREVRLGGGVRTLQLPYRRADEVERAGKLRGAQRFTSDAWYDASAAAVAQRAEERGTQPAEVQVLAVDEWAWASIPAEYFVEHQLRVKQEVYPRHGLMVSCANGMVGYVPTRQAFARGGYETTLMEGSRLAPEAGDMLADCAIELIKEVVP